MHGVEAAPKKTDLHIRDGCRSRGGPQGRFRPSHNPIDVGPSSVKFKDMPRPRGGMVDTRDLKSSSSRLPFCSVNVGAQFFVKNLGSLFKNRRSSPNWNLGHFLATFSAAKPKADIADIRLVSANHITMVLKAASLPGWRNGRRFGLKIRFSKGSAGSSPAPGTNLNFSQMARTC